MKERLLTNYVTTLVGLIILGAAIFMWTKGEPMEEVALIAGYGFIFLRSRDSLIGLGKKPVQDTTPKQS